ncbi:MAG: pyridoxamine 5'-phosphate oxidase family protein [Microcoleus sp.]
MLRNSQSKLRNKDKAVLSDRQQRIYRFLHANPIGVLSSVCSNGDPHGTVIYFTIDKNFVISFLTKARTRKYDNLKHCNSVMLTVFDAHTQTTAQITGNAVEIKDSQGINSVAGAVLRVSLKTSDAGMPPISKLKAGPYVAFRVELTQIRIGAYAHADPSDYTELFETVETFELKHD